MAVISADNSASGRTPPSPTSTPYSAQKTAKEQADAYANNLSNQTYLDAARAAAYGASTGQETDPRGLPVRTYDTTKTQYLGIDPTMAKYGYVAFNAPSRPADNAPEGQWKSYYDKLQKSVRPPQYQVGAQYQTFQGMDTKRVLAYQKQFADAGLYSKNDMVVPGRPSTKDYEIVSKLMAEGNIVGLSWEDALKMKTGARKGAFGGGGGAGGSTTSTQVSYTQTSIANGRALLQKTLGDAIGRAPSDVELKRYMKMVHDAESNSPTRTVTTTSRGAGGTSTVSRTTPSDVDTADMALQFAKNIGGGDPYRERKASHYLDLIINRGGLNVGG